MSTKLQLLLAHFVEFGEVLHKQQREHVIFVLVLSYRALQFVGGIPKFVFKIYIRLGFSGRVLFLAM